MAGPLPYDPNIQGALNNMPQGPVQGWMCGFLQSSDQDLMERIWPLSQMSPFAWLLGPKQPREAGLFSKFKAFIAKLLGIGEKGKGFADIINDPSTVQGPAGPLGTPGGASGIGIE